jgi:hypothetical protein
MASTIHSPMSLSYRALVVYLMSLDLVPLSLFLIPRLLHSVSVFFFSFFAVSADLLRASFAALRPLLSFFRAPTTTSFYRALLCTRSTYTRSISFSVFLFTCIQLCCFSFPCISLLFACNNALASMV